MASLAITLADELAAAVTAGRPLLPLEQLSAQGTLDPGRPVRLLDPRGRGVGAGLVDPENQVVRVLSRKEDVSFDAAFFARRVARAVELRRDLGLIGRSTCRVVHGEGDWLSGFTADLFGEFAVLYVYSRALIEHGRLIARALLAALGLRGVVLKVRPKGGAASGQTKQEVLGETPPEKLVVHEGDVPYEVHLLGGMNVGLFTDMREHRRGLQRFVGGKRVLNCFAYTGSLSVAAARAGAAAVTSVDLSSGVLAWAAENFRLSGLDPARHRFEASDVARYVDRAAKEGQRYDLIILDPPTYSSARASAWSMRNDYADLIAAAIRLLPEERGGTLWVSANTVREQHLLRYLDGGLKQAGRDAQILEIGGLPPDYPTAPGWPEGRYLEVCMVRIS